MTGHDYLAINGDPGSILVRWLKRGRHVGIHLLQLAPHCSLGAVLDHIPVHGVLVSTLLSHTEVLVLSLQIHAVNEGPES